MSPRIFGRLRAPASAAAIGAAVALLAALPAGAVVGGAAVSGPLARGAIMVLSSRGGVCSGVIVAPDVVLTAAHCAQGTQEYRVHYRGPDGAPVLISPAVIAIHPGYEARAVATRRRSIDLALLRLTEPLPPAFAALPLSERAPARGAAVTLGGWGVASEGDARSTGTFRTATLAAVEPYGPSRILLWAADPAAAAGACTGDSGGPIAHSDGAVAAVTSWASGRGKRGCGDVSQGVLVGPQRAWIDGTLAGWGRGATWQ